MYELSFDEYTQVSGGTCLSAEIFENVKDAAFRDGVTTSLITAGLVGAITLGASAAAVPTLIATAVTVPYAFMWGYSDSSAWNMVA